MRLKRSNSVLALFLLATALPAQGTKTPLSTFLGGTSGQAVHTSNPPFMTMVTVGSWGIGVDAPGNWTSQKIEFSDAGPFDFGIGAHPLEMGSTTVTFHLEPIEAMGGREVFSFQAVVGIDRSGGLDAAAQQGARFDVIVDGVTKASTIVSNGEEPSQIIGVDLVGAKTLTLSTTRVGSVFLGNHAAWGDASIDVGIPASAEPFGVGCFSGTGTAELATAPGSLPWINETFSLNLSSLPTTQSVTVFGIVGFSKTTWAGFTLPQDLGLIGAFGCTQYVSVDIPVLLTPSAGTSTWDIPLPNDRSLLRLAFFLQAATLDVAGPVMFSVTNAIEGRIGG